MWAMLAAPQRHPTRQHTMPPITHTSTKQDPLLSTAPRGNALRVGNMDLFQGTQNISVVKSDEDRLNPAIIPGIRGNAIGSGTNNYGEISSRPRLDQGINCQRTEPAILDAFRCNPHIPNH